MMESFRGVLANDLDAYMKLREKDLTPGSFQTARRTLLSFDALISQLGIKEKAVPEAVVSEWIRRLSEINARKTVSDKVSVLRKFLLHLQYSGYPVFIPSCPKTSDSYVPHLYSDDELELIFQTADQMPLPSKTKIYPMIHLEMPMFLRILYGCGLRSGEACRIKMQDINFRKGTILILKAKNRKQRIIPMHQTLTDMLQYYCLAMNIYGKPEAFLFPSADPQKHLTVSAARSYFVKILEYAGIYEKPEPHTRGKCIHCFRHVFTVKSFAQAEKLGRPLDDSVPYLSVYLGHYDMDGTEKYLKFSADMFPEYTDEFEAYIGDIFPEVDYEE